MNTRFGRSSTGTGRLRPIALTHRHNRPALVLEDPGGEPQKAWLNFSVSHDG
jgi:hypothetical protein